MNHKLFADKYFTSIPVIRYLSSQGICYAGTVRQNRLMGCPLPPVKKKDHGQIDEMVTAEGDVVITQWSDNRTVLLAPNFVGKGNVDQVRRWSE